MRYDNTMTCITNGVINFAGRYFMNIDQIRRNKVIVETPIAFYSNNPAGGVVSDDRIGEFTFLNYNPDVRAVLSIGRFY